MQDAQTSSTPNQEPVGLAAALARNVELSAENVKLRTDVAELRKEIK